MVNKILVEFDREDLEKYCKEKCDFEYCNPGAEKLIRCVFGIGIKFKIKDQNNEKEN